MRRSILCLALVLVAVPAAHAQQPDAVVAPELATGVATEAPLPTREAETTPTRAEAVETKREMVEVESGRETSARNLFTIIGVVVVVIALIAFLS